MAEEILMNHGLKLLTVQNVSLLIVMNAILLKDTNGRKPGMECLCLGLLPLIKG